MEDKELDELLSEEIEIPDQELASKIQKSVFRMTYGRIFIVLLSLFLLISGTHFVVDRVRDKNSFHLEDLEMLVTNEYNNTEEYVLRQNLTCYLATWVNLQHSSYALASISNLERTDYGEYSGTMYLNQVDKSAMNRPRSDMESVDFVIKDGKLVVTYYGSSVNDYTFSSGERVELQDIEKMPDSSIIMLDIKTNHRLSAEDMMAIYDVYPDSDITYLYCGEATRERIMVINGKSRTLNRVYPFGISVYMPFAVGYPEISEEYKDEYYHLYVLSDSGKDSLFGTIEVQNGSSLNSYSSANSQSITVTGETGAERLTKYYLGHLKLMIDSNILFDENWIDVYKEEYQNVLENGMTILGYRIIMPKEEAMKLISSRDYKTVSIVWMKASKYEK